MRPQKRSVTLKGHRTSVSLEDEFWHALRAIAEHDNIAINALIAQIDIDRGVDIGLASAIRLYVLEHIQSEISELKL